ncbi:ABC transporter permease [Pseudomonas sp. E141]|uniref:amino acid ABC transporter permease n=1 Tax=Pseudomonas TaxID=286 RepID=UPI0029344DCF|nr:MULTISPECIES: amino acid ABC transporter permease [unclassified Pseudomonas]MEA1028184.1 amino acid ABC transporter permease [Pseudomonas sp. N-137]WNZ76609.1 amino acid ABC transporter permease [Pseudomonas sp. P105]
MGYGELWEATHVELLQAAWATLRLAFGALVIGLAVGLLVALARLSGSRALRRCALFYIEIFRGTPALVQLFIVYFSLTAVGVQFSSFQAAMIGLGLNAAAYLSEIYRSGLEAVPKGQVEAAKAIGMPRLQVLRWVVLPQAIRIVLAPIGNVAISLLKDTSVASLIAAPDLMLRAQDLSSVYFMPLETYVLVGAMYFAMCYPLSMVVRRLERRRKY